MKYKNTSIVLGISCVSAFLFLGTATANNDIDTTDVNKSSSVNLEPANPRSFEHIVKLLPEDFKPAFTRETVLKLNGIVRRSYEVINEFDSLKKGNEASLLLVDSKATAEQIKLANSQFNEMQALSERSKSALEDMMKAVDTLKASQEHYNSAVLAGMVKFVKVVEHEVNEHSTLLAKVVKQA
ncbi:hypothetical protein [Paraglaciecola sp. 2405UD69-4]|uniref:hypothetical protein n=1 Tax=Paraglaciecola sp. 2405UD69-4 TaxID=3391836 RepID=UPI0039C8F8AD